MLLTFLVIYVTVAKKSKQHVYGSLHIKYYALLSGYPYKLLKYYIGITLHRYLIIALPCKNI